MVRILPEIQHNCCIKRYPDGGVEVIACEAAIFRERGWEAADKWAPEPRESASEAPDVAANLARAKRRARTMVRDYARANAFQYFVTLTLDAARVSDRYDIDACTRDIRTTLDNLVRRKGLQYVLVPEEHKDGAIHYHGFINAALPLEDSGTLSKGGRKPRKPRSARQRRGMERRVQRSGVEIRLFYGNRALRRARCCNRLCLQVHHEGAAQNWRAVVLLRRRSGSAFG